MVPFPFRPRTERKFRVAGPPVRVLFLAGRSGDHDAPALVIPDVVAVDLEGDTATDGAAQLRSFVDAEHALDPGYARKLGVNVDELLISQPDNGEQALEIADTLVRSGAIEVLVVDSVAALVPRAELEGEMGDAQMGAHARLMSQALRKLTASISRSNCMVIFINQLRMKIGDRKSTRLNSSHT